MPCASKYSCNHFQPNALEKQKFQIFVHPMFWILLLYNKKHLNRQQTTKRRYLGNCTFKKNGTLAAD